MEIKKIKTRGLKEDPTKARTVIAEVIIAKITNLLTVTFLRRLGKTKSARKPITDWKPITSPIKTELFREFSNKLGAQKEIKASASMTKDRARERVKTFDQTGSLRSLK